MSLLDNILSVDYFTAFVHMKMRVNNSLLMFSGREIDDSDRSMIKLAKNIAALSNIGGGDIIYGIATKRNRADSIEPIKDFSKTEEWLINEIQSQIDKPIKDLKINLLSFDSENKTKLLKVSIPANNNQPHMFADNKYYKWSGNKIQILDESEVRYLYLKLSTCELEFLGMYNTNGLPILNAGEFSSMSFYPKFLIRNAGSLVEKDYKIEISFPSNLYEETFAPLKALFIRHEGTYVVFGQNGNNKLFQQEISTIVEAKININADNIDTFLNEFIHIRLYYSEGVKKHSLKLRDCLTYNGKRLEKEDFRRINILQI